MKGLYHFIMPCFYLLSMSFFHPLHSQKSDNLASADIGLLNGQHRHGHWEMLGGGVNGEVRGISFDIENIYVTGDFYLAGGVEVVRVARWDGNHWFPLGEGVYGGAYAEGEPPDWCEPSAHVITSDGSSLYVGGFFRKAGSVSVNNIARWNGSAWSAMGYGLGGWYNNIDAVNAIDFSDNYVYGGGKCLSQGGIARWDGSQWITINDLSHFLWITIAAIAVSGNDVYVGGDFTEMDGLEAHGIACYHELTDTWSVLGEPGIEGVSGPVWDIAVQGSTIYVGGMFKTAAGVPVNNLARWDKSTGLWSAFGIDIEEGEYVLVGGLAVMEKELYLGRNIYNQGDEGVFANIKKWDGNEWTLIGEIPSGSIHSMEAMNDYIYVGGNFSEVSGTSVNNIARWRIPSQPPIVPEYTDFTRITSGPVVTDGGFSMGCAWCDYNDDGYIDLFVANDMNENNYLYQNNGDGTFIKITSGPVVEDGGYSYAGTWGDYDNDGDPDLYVANVNQEPNCLYQNNGEGTFIKVVSGEAVTDAEMSAGCCWADYNLDGYIDLFVANVEGENNSLYTNNGNGTFAKVNSGSIVTDGGNSLACGWADYDIDGYPDLFIANSGGENNFLYHNNGDGTFDKIGSGDIVQDGGESKSVSWGDYNNDGYPDLFVGNNFEENGLYQNTGNGSFVKITSGSIVSGNDHTRSSCWGDVNNDGLLDLFVSNADEYSCVYVNALSGSFTRYNIEAGRSRGCAMGDYDNDGDFDLCAAIDGQNNFLYANTGTGSNHWLGIKCIGTRSNPSAIGTRVTVIATINGISIDQYREISSQSGFGGQGSLCLEFGLGDAAQIDTILIEWPNGTTWDSVQVASDQFLTITEGLEVSVEPVFRRPGAFSLSQNHPNPFNTVTYISYSLPKTTEIRLVIYGIKGNEIITLVNERQEDGHYRVQWYGLDQQGRPVASGVYFFQLITENRIMAQKMLYLK